MKKAFSLIVACVLILTSFVCISVSAASTESIVSVHFDLYPNADGTLDVTEIWNVEYAGTGEGFTRWIDTSASGLTDLQTYDSITDVSVKINGNAITESTAETDYFNYGSSADGKSFNILITSPSAAEEKEYTVSYTVNGALKKQGKDVRVAYMLIGNTMQYTCNNVTAAIHIPEGVVGADVVINDEAQALVNDSSVEYNAGRVYSTFAVDVSLPSDVFDTSALASYSAFGNALKSFGQALLKVIYVVIAVAAAAAVIVFTLFYEKIRRFAVEKKAKKNTADAPVSLPEGTSACKAYKMLVPYSRINPKSTTKKIPALFAMAILECIEKGYIVQKGDDLIVGIPEGEEDAYILSVLNFLTTFCDKKFNRYVITSEFGEKVSTECMANYDAISNYLASFYELIPDMDSKFLKDENNRKLYTDSFLFKNAVKKDGCKCTFAQGTDAVLNGAKTSDKQIFALLLTSKIFDASGKNCSSALAQAVGAMYNVFVKSK
ncbi:MAG: DUF2207 domain-containing protein [Clostridia bacterium]|nr:DUF2207 domain-containing protein [Clostridia bacterium]